MWGAVLFLNFCIPATALWGHRVHEFPIHVSAIPQPLQVRGCRRASINREPSAQSNILLHCLIKWARRSLHARSAWQQLETDKVKPFLMNCHLFNSIFLKHGWCQNIRLTTLKVCKVLAESQKRWRIGEFKTLILISVGNTIWSWNHKAIAIKQQGASFAVSAIISASCRRMLNFLDYPFRSTIRTSTGRTN